jgi:uncharacterized membrane protein
VRDRFLSWALGLAIAAGLVDCLLAAPARPFTLRADVTTGVGIGGVLLLGLLGALRRRPAPEEPPPAGDAAVRRVSRPALLAWATLAAAVASFELGNFVASPRSQHPTISSLLAVAEGHEVWRALLFGAWLGVGWWLWGPS